MAEYDSVIPAGGSGTLTARVETKVVQNGKVSKSVTVHTDARGSEIIRLVINFEAVASILALPRLRLHLNVVEGEPGTARLLLRRADGEPLEVTGSTDEPGDLPIDLRIVGVPVADAASVPGIGRAEPGDVWLEARMAPHAESLRWSGELEVTTNHPRAPRLKVPVSVWVQPLFDVRPQRVSLWVHADEADAEPVTVRLTHANRREFEITNLEVSHPDLFSAVALTDSARRFHTIQVRLNDGVDSSKVQQPVRGSLRVHASDPAKPVIDIQVGLSPVRDGVRRPTAGMSSRPSSSDGHVAAQPPTDGSSPVSFMRYLLRPRDENPVKSPG